MTRSTGRTPCMGITITPSQPMGHPLYLICTVGIQMQRTMGIRSTFSRQISESRDLSLPTAPIIMTIVNQAPHCGTTIIPVSPECDYLNRRIPIRSYPFAFQTVGITRLNVYSGMAGFYILRDSEDTGLPGNLLKLPTYPYEIPLAIQDRMFKENGELFYPSFQGDPYWEDFIEGEGATIGEDDSSAMAEFFGDFMVVNG